MDDALGKWAYHGHLKKIDYKGGGTMGEKATVVLPSGAKGSTVNLRNVPSTSGDIIARIPVGTVVDVIEDTKTAGRGSGGRLLPLCVPLESYVFQP